MNKIKIGIIVNESYLLAWQNEILTRLLFDKRINTKKIVIQKNIKEKNQSISKNNIKEKNQSISKNNIKIFIKFILPNIFHKYLLLIYNFFHKYLLLLYNFFKLNNIELLSYLTKRYIHSQIPDEKFSLKKIFESNILQKLESINVNIFNQNSFLELFEKDSLKVKNENFDFIINFDSKSIDKKSLNLSKYGILEYNFNKIIDYEKFPIGFWECYYNKSIIQTSLKLFSETNKNGLTLGTSTTSVNPLSFALTMNQAIWDSIVLLEQSLIKFFKYRFDELKNMNTNNSVNSNTFKFPGRFEIYLYLLKNLIRSKTNKYFKKPIHHWFLIYLDRNTFINNQIELNTKILKRNLKILQSPKGFFWADPFIIKHKDSNYIFFEDYDYKLKKGHISCIKFNDGKILKKEIIINEKYHLSFPFIFSLKDDYFIIPESFENCDLSIYQSINFPYEWKKTHQIFKDRKCADPVLYKKNEIFFLFFTEQYTKFSSVTNCQRLYYSNDIFGEWIEHPLSPISLDCRYSRAAGKIFEYKKKLIRPVQDCSMTYGYKINLMEIVDIDEHNFKEKLYLSINSEDFSLLGMHHIDISNDYIFLDGKTNFSSNIHI